MADDEIGAVNTQNTFHFKPLFPAANESQKIFDESKNDVTADSFKWLQNASYSAETHRGFTELQAQKTVIEDCSENLTTSGTSQPVVTDNEKKSEKQKKKKRRHSPSPPVKSKFELEQEFIAKSTKKVFIEDTGLLPEHAFRIDRKPDQNNLAFSCFGPQQTARYYVDKHVHLGMSNAQVAAWLLVKRGKQKKSQRNAYRYHSRQNVNIVYNEEDILDYSRPRLVFSKEKFQSKIIACNEYLPVEISVNEIKTSKGYQEEDKAYLSGNTIPIIRSDAENVKLLNEAVKKETQAELITRRTIEYNQQLRDTPGDEAKWLEFIAFQDEAMLASFDMEASSTDRKSRKMTEKAIFERKLSILEKAIMSLPTSVELIVSKLRLCQKYWEPTELRKEWNKLLFIHPNSTLAWESYLLHLQSYFSSFSTSEVIKGYAKCLKKLTSLLDGTFTSHDPPPDLGDRMLGIFINLCNFLHQTGNREKALANFQAMIEFNFFSPTNLKSTMSLNDWLAFFEPFWDSGVPRFGEKGAKGWAAVMETKQLPEGIGMSLVDTDAIEDKIVETKLSRNITWLQLEKVREENHWLPWRQNAEQTEDDCEDPERIVLFDDINPFLFRLPTIELKFRLVQTFLTYLGFRCEPHFISICPNFNCHCPASLELPSSLIPCHKQLRYRFEKISPLPAIMVEETSIRSNVAFKEFVDNVLEQSLRLFDEPYVTEIQVQWLQLKRSQLHAVTAMNAKAGKHLLKESRKFAKSILKEESNRNKLPLWLEYCKLELESGQTDEVKKVLNTVLSMHPQSPLDTEDSVLCRFYKLYAEIEMDFRNVNAANASPERLKNALAVLISLATGEKLSSIVKSISPLILKARRRFQTSLEAIMQRYVNQSKSDSNFNLVSSFQTNMLVEWIPCYAMFQYLTLGIQHSTIVYETAFDSLKQLKQEGNNSQNEKIAMAVNSDIERLYFAYLELLLHHVNTTTTSLKMIHTVLYRALSFYPHNTHFLQLLVDIESRSHVAGRLRRHFGHSIKINHFPAVPVYAMLAELLRQQNLQLGQTELPEYCRGETNVLCENGISQQIRSLFESALEFPENQHCPLLWRLYMKYELQLKNTAKAKSIFYRAVQECGWNKKIYLEASQIPDLLQEILDIMTEKELRVRIPIEEVDLLMGHDEEMRKRAIGDGQHEVEKVE